MQPRQIGSASSLAQILGSWFVWGCVIYKDKLWRMAAAFLADLWAHSASYLVGFVGGIVLLVRVWRSRGRAAKPEA